jgi:hypothetical protein
MGEDPTRLLKSWSESMLLFLVSLRMSGMNNSEAADTATSFESDSNERIAGACILIMGMTSLIEQIECVQTKQRTGFEVTFVVSAELGGINSSMNTSHNIV